MFQRILMGMGMLADKASDVDTVTNDVLYSVINYINSILAALIGVAVMIGIVYAIVVGARMARANNAEEREEAKKKVVYTVIGIAVAVALMLVLLVLKDKIPEWMGLAQIKKGTETRWIQSGSTLPEGWSWVKEPSSSTTGLIGL